MDYIKIIKHIYPALVFWKDFLIQWDLENPDITRYNTTIPQPTQAELETAWVEVEAIQQAEAIRQAKSEQIAQIATLTDQLNLLWRTVYKLTEWSTDPEIIEARQAYEAIQTVLNS